MFDFFRDMARELSGVRKPESPVEVPQKKKDRRIPKWAKALIITMGVVYLLMAVPQILIVTQLGLEQAKKILAIVIYVVQALLDLTVIISLLIGKKKGEIVAIICGVVFILVMYVSLYIM